MHAVLEARRAAPAILFLPHLQLWWETAPASLRATLTRLLADLPPDLPLLLLATADCPMDELDAEALKLFGSGGSIHLGLHQTTGPVILTGIVNIAWLHPLLGSKSLLCSLTSHMFNSFQH